MAEFYCTNPSLPAGTFSGKLFIIIIYKLDFGKAFHGKNRGEMLI